MICITFIKINQRYKEIAIKSKTELEDLKENSDGLICLTGGIHGPIAKLFLKNDVKGADNLIQKFLSIYKDNLFIELFNKDSIIKL